MTKPRTIWWIPLLYIGILFLTNIIGVILYDYIDIADPDMKLIRFGSISNLLFYGSLFILYIVLFVPAWKTTLSKFKHRFPQMVVYILAGAAAMFVTMVAMGYIYFFIGVDDQAQNQALLELQLNGPLLDRAALILFAVLLAPFVEEMMFRLAGFRIFKRYPNIPKWAVILITSILFGLIHVLGDNLIQIVYYAGLGIILGIIYDKSKNIMVPIVVHMIFNGFVTALMFIGI